MDEHQQNRIAVFRFGVISDFVNRPGLDLGFGWVGKRRGKMGILPVGAARDPLWCASECHKGKDGECRHQSVRHGDSGLASASFTHLLEGAQDDPEEGIGVQVLAHRGAEQFVLLDLALSLELSWSHGDSTYTSPMHLSIQRRGAPRIPCLGLVM
jgi:hypothetical protein